MDWDGRVVLVTGGSRGIGLATAKRFRDGGARVVIAGRSEEALASAAASLGHDGRVSTVVADVGTVAAATPWWIARSPPSASSTCCSPTPAATSPRRWARSQKTCGTAPSIRT